MGETHNQSNIGSGVKDLPRYAIYVHGLASGRRSSTYGQLSRRFNQYSWVAVDFGEDLAQNVERLNALICHYNPELIVGTSMGALELLYADAPNAVKIACNPALSLAQCVRTTIGLGRHQYLCPREDGATELELTEQMCQSYEQYIALRPILQGSKNYAIFARHDELIGDKATAQAMQIVAQSGFEIYIDECGEHRVNATTLEIIAQIVDQL